MLKQTVLTQSAKPPIDNEGAVVEISLEFLLAAFGIVSIERQFAEGNESPSVERAEPVGSGTHQRPSHRLQECPDHFLVFGERHLNHIVQEYVAYHHTERPHQGLKNRVPLADDAVESWVTPSVDQMVSHERLGGLLKHYVRRAA